MEILIGNIRGPKGDNGERGEQGLSGEKGEKGDTGAAGRGVVGFRYDEATGNLYVEMED